MQLSEQRYARLYLSLQRPNERSAARASNAHYSRTHHAILRAGVAGIDYGGRQLRKGLIIFALHSVSFALPLQANLTSAMHHFSGLLFIFIWLLTTPITASAQQSADFGKGTKQNEIGPKVDEKISVDSFVISLLTCTAGQKTYELYGHSALRVKNVKTNEDLVYNYGVFSFSKPNFTWRFVLGQTDYTVGVVPTPYFIAEYVDNGRSIREQVLALRPTEAARLVEALRKNAAEPDWTYRYNFLGDNCASRLVVMIEQALDGSLELPPEKQRTTFRDIIHSCVTPENPWDRFGQDIILGCAVDTPLTSRAELAFPFYTESILRRANVVRGSGERQALVSHDGYLVEVTPRATKAKPFFTPLKAVWLLLFLACAAAWAEHKRRGRLLGQLLDDFLMLVTGLAGCLVFLLFFFSEHPAVDSNWLIVWLNPLPLLLLPWKIWRDRKGRSDFYTPYVDLFLVVYLLISAFFQQYPPEIYILASVLLVRGLSLYSLQRNGRKKSCAGQKNISHQHG